MCCAIKEWTGADCLKAGMHNELKSYLDANLEETEDVVGWWGVSFPFLLWNVVLIWCRITWHSTPYSYRWPGTTYLFKAWLLPLNAPSQTHLSPINTKQCNWLAPDTFKALQILKSAYQNGHISALAEAEKYYHILMCLHFLALLTHSWCLD